jgi:hypothetical protein
VVPAPADDAPEEGVSESITVYLLSCDTPRASPEAAGRRVARRIRRAPAAVQRVWREV